MAFLDLLRARLQGRAIDPAALPAGTARELVEAARWAPSCRNHQPWRFHACEAPATLAALRPALAEGNRPWAGVAPLLLVATVRTDDDCRLDDGRTYADFDLGLATMNVMLAATERGLMCRPMAGFDPGGVREALGLGDDVRPVVLLAIGRPGDGAGLPAEVAARGLGPRLRKTVDEIASFR